MADAQIKFRFGGKVYDDVGLGINDFVAQFRKEWAGGAQVASKFLKDYLDHVAAELAAKHGAGQTTDNSLARGTGALIGSVIKSVKVTGKDWDNLKGFIGGSKLVAIHEFGGTIEGKNGNMLTIPLPAAKNSSGRAPPFARQWTNTFVGMSKAGNLLIFQRRGKGNIVPLYILVDSVTIKPRLGLRQTLQSEIPYFVDKMTDAVAAAVLRGMKS